MLVSGQASRIQLAFQLCNSAKRTLPAVILIDETRVTMKVFPLIVNNDHDTEYAYACCQSTAVKRQNPDKMVKTISDKDN